ncbi:MAG: thioredoxin family protein [Opitutaceae bacterium]
MVVVKRIFFVCLGLWPSVFLAAELGVGSSRAEVVAQLGTPKSKLSAGEREILSYPSGRIVLADGKVVSIDWKGPLPSPVQAPAAPAIASAVPPVSTRTLPPENSAAAPVLSAAAQVAPPVSAPTKAPQAAAARDVWFTDFTAAQAEAAATNRRLLVLFTGTDWCPPCIEFEANVAHAKEFLSNARPDFVLVKLDYPRNTPQPPALRARNDQLARRYGIASYPSLLVITADGAKSSRVDTTRRRKADGVVDYYVQAVDEARRPKAKSSFWPW